MNKDEILEEIRKGRLEKEEALRKEGKTFKEYVLGLQEKFQDRISPPPIHKTKLAKSR